MTSKKLALRVLDCVFITVTIMLVLSIVGVPMETLRAALGMSAHEMREFGLFLVFASLMVIHAIVTSDSAP